MYTHSRIKKIDPNNPMKAPEYGIIEKTIQIGEKIRRYLIYIPDDIREATAGVFVLGPNGVTADDLLKESGWKELAYSEERKEHFVVFFLEPENGKWNTNEIYGLADGDIAYVDKIQSDNHNFDHFCVHESKFYLFGIREGGIIANMAALWNPSVYAGIASIGGSDVQNSYVEIASNDYCSDLDGFTDFDFRKKLKKSDIPVPAWIIEDPDYTNGIDRLMVQYWCKTCGVEKSAHQIEPDIAEYYRKTSAPYGVNQDKEAFRVCHSIIPESSQNYGKKLIRRIWKDFLYKQRRWRSGPGGDLRVVQDPVHDIGMEYFYQNINGWMREWYVYIPNALKNTDYKPVPLVIALHGYTCSGEIYIGNSNWHKVAEENNFIVIFPTATYGYVNAEYTSCKKEYVPLPRWNYLGNGDEPDDFLFIAELIKKVSDKYRIDRTRIYVTGHSNGSMMTQALALKMPNVFAAAAPCSGILMDINEENSLAKQPWVNEVSGFEMPVWMFWGEYEFNKREFLPNPDNRNGKSIGFWLMHNGMNMSTKKKSVDGRWNDLIFYNARNMPTVKYTWVEYMPHATMPEMSFRIWNEFFSKFSRKDGLLVYKDEEKR